MPFVDSEDIHSARIDYLIVGGGTAGLTLASRLTEDPGINVLVVEAGECHDNVPEIDVPGLMGKAIANPEYDWTFLTTPQKHVNNRAILQPRGKGLGGSSLLNFIGMFRPSKNEMDTLEKLGNEGWNWEDMLYYMKKSETLQLADLSEADQIKFAAKPDLQYHGTAGPIKKSCLTGWYEMHAKMFDAVENMGIPRNPETGGGKNDGAMTSFISVDADTAKRSYAYPEYLKPHIERENLMVLTDTYVTKIILQQDGSLQKATGVAAIRNGDTFEIIRIQRDVIVACGTFQTPQILELSGIGNPHVLSKFGIDTIIDLPGVGENLQDHVGVATFAEVDTVDETYDDLAVPEVAYKHEQLYKQRRGLLTNCFAVAQVFLLADALGDAQDMSAWTKHARAGCEDKLTNTLSSLRSGLEKQFQVQKAYMNDKQEAIAELIQGACRPPFPYGPPPQPGKRYTSLICTISHPLSPGSTHISSTDPLAPPAINPNYYANEADLDLHVKVVQTALKVYETAPMKDHVKEVLFPDKDTRARGAEGIREFILETAATTYHPVGTAAMLPREDGGVVDPSLKVYGTSNLRVVDASILPLELSSHIQSVVYAIGEKAADIIKTEYEMKDTSAQPFARAEVGSEPPTAC